MVSIRTNNQNIHQIQAAQKTANHNNFAQINLQNNWSNNFSAELLHFPVSTNQENVNSYAEFILPHSFLIYYIYHLHEHTLSIMKTGKTIKKLLSEAKNNNTVIPDYVNVFKH